MRIVDIVSLVASGIGLVVLLLCLPGIIEDFREGW